MNEKDRTIFVTFCPFRLPFERIQGKINEFQNPNLYISI